MIVRVRLIPTHQLHSIVLLSADSFPPTHLLSSVQLLRKEPENRLPLTEVSRHPWILKYKKKGASGTGV